MFNTLKITQTEKQIYPQRIIKTKWDRKEADRNPWPWGQKRSWRDFMVSPVCRIGSGIRGSHMACGRALVVCSRCGGILWRGRIRRASSLASVCEAKLRLLLGPWFCDETWAVLVELDYADVHGDAPQVYPEQRIEGTIRLRQGREPEL
jgi:hypothetical protein